MLCCLNGAQCGVDSLCYMPGGTGGNEWFVGGCTDRTYGDPVCRGNCTGDDQTWIFYNATASKWQCCGNKHCCAVCANKLEHGIEYGFPHDFIYDLQRIDKREYQQRCFLKQQQQEQQHWGRSQHRRASRDRGRLRSGWRRDRSHSALDRAQQGECKGRGGRDGRASSSKA
ncbi:hypothetical protein LTR74_017137 [Friedmanniomyces endolithicus]|nr:hypothetical protein LTR74_017137 [Friedmanniomyces endolithicus]